MLCSQIYIGKAIESLEIVKDMKVRMGNVLFDPRKGLQEPMEPSIMG
jgi:hypothetical protein